ncbi:hypothetical protein QQS21_012417 [Conoideocrella luteorostrata]|uniref:DH domain-containing protein n=1 Tax=Conoideocrella luteorostrata TaxID=1105319 RepID=A0AAJ0CBJ6_9HYPO|nr:hypothetical protein QQS21_012417 [Conoideocrella luteorostrata]
MDPAPDAGQLPDDAVDTRLGTLGHHNLHHNFDRLDQLDHTEGFALQSLPSTTAYIDSDLRSNLKASPSYHDSLAAAEAAEASIPDSYPTTYHDPASVDNHHAPPSPIDPDDFYKNYRGPDASTGPAVLPMAATSSSRPSLRSNGDGSTPKHPAVSANKLSLPRANLRSVSSPLDSRPSTNSSASGMASSKPSVKDLKKRFDQNATAGVPTIPPLPSRTGPSSRYARPRIRSDHGTSHASSLSSSRDAQTTSEDGAVGGGAVGATSLPPQSKFVADDLVSSSAKSFASRIGKPRNSIERDKTSQGSMANLPHKSPPQHLQAPASSAFRVTQPHGLLFGEILPDQHDASVVGHGIEGARQRRTSEPTVQNTESSSPSPYGRNPPSRPEGSVTGSLPRPQPRSRAHSDDGSSSPSTRAARNHMSKTSPHSSKLPVSVRKLSTPSNSTSPSSTRSSSPSTLKRYQASGRPTRTSPTAHRAKTPTRTRNSITPSNSSNARLQAYVAVPPAKLSPTLRSSRPRQPVSIASTSSSRMKETDKSRTGKNSESTGRRRKISIGPIDFEQRREHIRLAYTKSIRESEALEARHKADADKAIRDMENLAVPHQVVENSSSSTDAPDTSQIAVDIETVATHSGTSHESQQTRSDDAGALSPEDGEQASQAGGWSSKPKAAPPLTISTEKQPSTTGQDSPTLGLPGSFPDQTPPRIGDEPPLSAISATSDTTEFDTEPQTYPPVQARSPLDIPITVVKPPSPHKQQKSQSRTEYQYPFDDEPESPVRVSPKKEHTKLPAADLDVIPAVPGSFVDDPQQSEGEGLGIGSFQSQETSVTIVPSSQSEAALFKDGKETIPFPRLDSQYDSDCQSDLDPLYTTSNQGRQDDDAITDTCTEETDDHEGHELHHREYYEDHAGSFRTSTCASSEAGAYDDLQYSSYEQHQQYDTPSSGNLLMPRSRSQDDRLSRQSAWTDFSIESNDRSDPTRSSAIPSNQEPAAFGHVTIFSSRVESLSNDTHINGPELRESEDSRLSSTHHNSLHLPELDTGGGFSVPYLSPETDDNTPYVPSPIHEPPPVPPSASGSGLNSRTSSAFYDQSQYESTLLNSERGSDEYTSHAGTTQSIDSASLATTDQYVSTQTPADSDSKSVAQDGEELNDKERHRLIQRRNVMKELIDTEAVFVRDMNIVEEIYKGTAEACPKLDSKTIKLVFRNSDEIIAFHTSFLSELKEAVADVYIPKGARAIPRDDSSLSAPSFTTTEGPNDIKDRCTSIGPVFKNNMEQMKLAHEGFLRASDQAAKRLIQIQQDPTVQVWLNECNEVAKDLTAAWDLDSLLIKPMQRITKYPNLIITLLQHTPHNHPDRDALLEAKDILETAIIEINKTKKNFELVGQIVGRKRKESDVKAGFARAFGKRVDKLQASNNRPAEDTDYAKLNEKFGDDYLRLQVVLRDIEFYTRQVSAYVHEFLQYMSSIELVMRLQPGNYPELESKWVQFNISVRDLEKVALEEHLSQVRKHVIEPFEHVIKAYGNPSLAMKKRQKRRLDFERSEQLRRSGRSPDPKLKELVEQYEALNDTLKKELPLLSAMTEKIGNICIGNFVNIQAKWYSIWKDKMKSVVTDCSDTPDLQEVVSTFECDFPYANDQLANIGILNPATWGRTSLSASMSVDDASMRTRARPSDLESRSRGQSVNGDVAPTLPAPDFGSRRSGTFTMSPSSSATGFVNGNVPSPHHYYYRDYYAGINSTQGGLSSPRSPEFASGSRSGAGTGMASTRPSTGRSYESGMPRQSSDSAVHSYRDSNTTYNSNSVPQETQRETHRFSNMFHSAMPASDGPDETSSQRQSRASSRERSQTSDGYNVLWLAASLFEFNISTTKHEAGYPYLTYQAGEIFDVIAEKGELWLAKNQDDPTDQVGWIWSKHFAKLADS